jgi:hypothetical protein
MRSILQTVLAVLWLGAILLGMGRMMAYETTAGAPASAAEQWPSDAGLTRTLGEPTLVVFAHPRCPCTRATVTELEQLMTRFRGRLTATVLFYKPSGFPDGWERTDLWQRASALEGVRVVSDTDGAEARRFGAATSGQVLLYDARGRALFRGGITGARGKSGDNDGARAIAAIVEYGGTAPSPAARGERQLQHTGTAGAGGDCTITPVYGCSILGTQSNK